MEENSSENNPAKTKMWHKPLFETTLSKAILILGAVIVVILIFLIGENIGYQKAEFSGHFGDNYNNMFGRGSMIPDDSDLLDTHGASGTIVKIDLPEVFIEGDNGVETIITLNNMSLIKELRASV